MPRKKAEPPKGKMIHIRLTNDIHKQLKMKAVESDTTIQELVEELIRNYTRDNPDPDSKLHEK
jgi:predicted HicB family RNase H-like nuclease